MVILTTTLVAVVGFRVYSTNHPKLPAPEKVKASRQDVLRGGAHFLSEPTGKWLLLEFASYQCPACSQTHAKLASFLGDHQNLTYGLILFPLRQHRLAMPATEIAETSQLSGNFWQANTLLWKLGAKLTLPSLALVTSELGVSPSQLRAAKKAVERRLVDGQKLASILHLQSTPSFYLANPDGEVFSIADLDQVELVMGN